jgi:DNA-binding transcriptional ArsR family regulator
MHEWDHESRRSRGAHGECTDGTTNPADPAARTIRVFVLIRGGPPPHPRQERRAEYRPPALLLTRTDASGEGRTRVSREAKVAQALQEMGGMGTTDEIARRTGMAESNVSHALRKMMALGQVRRLARDGYRVPYELVR